MPSIEMLSRRAFTSLLAGAAGVSILPHTVRGQEVWIISSEDNFPPYNFSRGDKRTGMDTEIVEAVLSHMGVRYEHRPVPWQRVLFNLDQNQTTMAFQFVGTEQRRLAYNLVGPHRDGLTVLAVPAESPITVWDKLQDFTGKTVGIVQGFSYTPEFDAAGYLVKEPANNNELNLRKLAFKRLDLAIGDLYTMRYLAAVNGLTSGVRFLERPVAVVPRYIAFPKPRVAEAERFGKALDEVKARGVVAAIIESWASRTG